MKEFNPKSGWQEAEDRQAEDQQAEDQQAEGQPDKMAGQQKTD